MKTKTPWWLVALLLVLVLLGLALLFAEPLFEAVMHWLLFRDRGPGL